MSFAEKVDALRKLLLMTGAPLGPCSPAPQPSAVPAVAVGVAVARGLERSQGAEVEGEPGLSDVSRARSRHHAIDPLGVWNKHSQGLERVMGLVGGVVARRGFMCC